MTTRRPVELSRPTDAGSRLSALAVRAREYGFAALQLKSTQYLPQLGDAPGLRRLLDDAGIGASSLIWLGDVVAGHADLVAIAEFATAVGASRLIVCDATEPGSAPVRTRARRIDGVAADIADRGVTLSLHHHHGHPVESLADILEFAEAAPHARVTIDTAHLGLAGELDLVGAMARLGARVDNVHLKDLDRSGFRLVGEGDLALAELVDWLRGGDFDGAICIDEESGAPLDTGLLRSLRALRNWGLEGGPG